MADTPVIKERAKSKSFTDVMDDAAKRAQTRFNETGGCLHIVVDDVFKSLCALNKDVFSQMLGKTVDVPEVQPMGDMEVDPCIGESSEVSRLFFPFDGVVEQMLKKYGAAEAELSASVIAATLIYDSFKPVMNILTSAGIKKKEAEKLVEAFLKTEETASKLQWKNQALLKRFEDINKIREYLAAHCFGQDEAIDTLIKQLSIHWTMYSPDRGGKPLSFFFAGAPGTGKNFLATLLQEAFEKILGIKKLPVLDLARYCSDQNAIDLIGRGPVWQGGSQPGALTSLAAENPEGLIVIDNYECGENLCFSYINKVLETGSLRDDGNDLDVSFEKNIFIIITHERNFANSEDFISLVSDEEEATPRDKIIEGLVKYEPKFYSTLRLIDTPILFSKHDFKSFLAITKDRLTELEEQFSTSYGIKCFLHSEEVYQVLIDMHPNVESAHPIVSGLENAILLPVQGWLLKNVQKIPYSRNIRIECDPLPEFEGAPERKDFASFEEWMEKRTTKRILRARRLFFKSKVEFKGDTVMLRFTDMSYKVLPSIEDCDYFSVTVPDVSFNDLVGVDTVKEHISEIIEYMNDPKKARVKPDTGMILYGPPGTGKTSVAKAIANEMGVPFINVSASDFSKVYLGQGVAEVKKLFAAARRYGAVIFIDEIDAIGSRKTNDGSGGVQENNKIINALLTELDGFKDRNFLVIGATNRYNALDEALVRPGRLSLKIQLGLLHKSEDRRRLIEETLNNTGVKVAPKIIEKLVQTTNAWSPADLVAMINGGVRRAQKEHKVPSFKHFAQARTTVTEGEDPQSEQGSQETRHLVAVHEAGHAVVAVLRGIPIVQVTVEGIGDTAGFLERVAGDGISTKESLEKQIDVNLGGRAAEEILAAPSTGVQSDFEDATFQAARMVRLGLENDNLTSIYGESDTDFSINHRREINGLLDARMAKVRTLLNNNYDFLKAVAETLEKQKILFEADIISLKETIEKEYINGRDR